MLDVIVAGAGPAGAIAALRLARAGARVVLIDRETFPRDKLCGDTLNPGAVRLLASLGLQGGVLREAKPLAGMYLTGPHASVRAFYRTAPSALAIVRRDLDAWILGEAIAAGVRFEGGFVATRPLLDYRAGAPVVRGLALSKIGSTEEIRMPAMMTIAADGRRSRLARLLNLTRSTRAPQRWAYGAYASGVQGVGDVGEMHIRRGW